MQHTDKAIAEFEAWWRDNMNTQEMDLHRFGDGYACHETNRGWMAWKASREALVIELPPGVPDNPKIRQDRNKAISDCRDAIEAAGVTVRG
ncbi:hypothetical protein BSR09_00745 [Stutzerimonas degradans]|nr:hypothetical protein BSR09_00745 [Stutzerimonas degradans]